MVNDLNYKKKYLKYKKKYINLIGGVLPTSSEIKFFHLHNYKPIKKIIFNKLIIQAYKVNIEDFEKYIDEYIGFNPSICIIKINGKEKLLCVLRFKISKNIENEIKKQVIPGNKKECIGVYSIGKNFYWNNWMSDKFYDFSIPIIFDLNNDHILFDTASLFNIKNFGNYDDSRIINNKNEYFIHNGGLDIFSKFDDKQMDEIKFNGQYISQFCSLRGNNYSFLLRDNNIFHFLDWFSFYYDYSQNNNGFGKKVNCISVFKVQDQECDKYNIPINIDINTNIKSLKYPQFSFGSPMTDFNEPTDVIEYDKIGICHIKFFRNWYYVNNKKLESARKTINSQLRFIYKDNYIEHSGTPTHNDTSEGTKYAACINGNLNRTGGLIYMSYFLRIIKYRDTDQYKDKYDVFMSDAYLFYDIDQIKKKKNKYVFSLQFATGCIVKNNMVMISYGDGDYYSSLCLIPKSEIESYLKHKITDETCTQDKFDKEFKYLFNMSGVLKENILTESFFKEEKKEKEKDRKFIEDLKILYNKYNSDIEDDINDMSECDLLKLLYTNNTIETINYFKRNERKMIKYTDTTGYEIINYTQFFLYIGDFLVYMGKYDFIDIIFKMLTIISKTNIKNVINLAKIKEIFYDVTLYDEYINWASVTTESLSFSKIIEFIKTKIDNFEKDKSNNNMDLIIDIIFKMLTIISKTSKTNIENVTNLAKIKEIFYDENLYDEYINWASVTPESLLYDRTLKIKEFINNKIDYFKNDKSKDKSKNNMDLILFFYELYNIVVFNKSFTNYNEYIIIKQHEYKIRETAVSKREITPELEYLISKLDLSYIKRV